MHRAQGRDSAIWMLLLWRQGLPVAIGILAIWLISGHFAAFEMQPIAERLTRIEGPQWTIAILASAVSLAAAARYDLLIHRWLGTGVRGRSAIRAGFTAVALSQLLGFGLVTGTLVRARCLPGLGLWRAARVTLTVGLTFVIGWGFLAALFWAGQSAPWIGRGLLGAFIVAAGYIAWSAPPRLPGLALMARLFVLVSADLAAACVAFAVLFPGHGPALTEALAPFVLALGSGIASAVPGGVGPFETILSQTLNADMETLLTAVVAFRLVYFAGPGLLAAMILLSRQRAHVFENAGPHVRTLPPGAAPLKGALRAESGLGAPVLHLGQTPLMATGRAGQVRAGLFDPLCARLPVGLARKALTAQAGREGLVPALYKCGPRAASEARAAGWSVRRIASEAVIRPASFDPEDPGYGQLRRKLRKAKAEGLTITRAPRPLPLEIMEEVARDWSGTRQGAMGFSMGAFCPHLLYHQRVYLAHLGNRLVGFVSVHDGSNERTLDLVRHTGDAPDGTVQALVAEAIAEARANGIPRLSLAAIPDHSAPPIWLATGLSDWCPGTGLRRFKQAFRPAWEPRYLAAPGPFRLAIAGLEIARAIAPHKRRT